MARSHLSHNSADYSEKLRSQMQTVGLSNFRELAEAAGVSTWQVRQLRRGNISVMRLAALQKLSRALNLSLPDFLQQFTDESCESSSLQSTNGQTANGATAAPSDSISAAGLSAAEPNEQLKQEYERLQRQLEAQKTQLQEAFQRESLQQIESWLTFWPTAVHSAKQNPDIPATKLLPLVRPVEQLLESWGVSPIAAVGDEVPYDPQQHQLMNGAAEPGEMVKVRNVGYRHGDRLLHRAKVSPK